MKGKKGFIYRIRLSENMLIQARHDDSIKHWLDDNLKEFENYDKAYYYIISKWGSACLNVQGGLVIDKKKIGSKEWRFTYGA